ncbi:5-formyltetrahydrofolate cyclo-ligase [Campylobacter sp. RM16190]|uniref:5-formyltetrahydrofolate cyclo-ligase n=1 Tax=Campylobacter sp. RM16190 TaxID=1705727 RepID=UPI001B8BB82A|nr:5-formyltetrahydrofolate cyclo-ligase [Campylobacter sp. RM16190]
MKKENFRKHIKNRLKTELKFRARCSHYGMFKPLLKLLEKFNAKRVLIFSPLPSEPNLNILKRTLVKKCEIFIPFMSNLNLKMVKSRLPLMCSKFGIKEPLGAKFFQKRIDVAIIPVVGVDGNMARIGHGKGFYDRFFCNLPYRPIVIFVQIKDTFIHEIITEDHDVQCDFYITPRKIYIKRGIYDRDFSRIGGWCGRRWRRVSCSKKDK